MKRTAIASALAAVALSLVGCASIPGDLAKAIPEGHSEHVDAVITGKFSSTTIKASDVNKRGDTITAGELHIRHSNVYVPLIQVDITGFTPPPH